MDNQTAAAQTPAAPAAASASMNQAPAPQQAEMHDLGGSIHLTTAEQHTLTRDLLAKGMIKDEATANEMLRAEGIEPLPSQGPPVYKTAEQLSFEKSYAPARPQDFVLPPIRPGDVESENAQRAAQDAFRGYLSEMQLPAKLGQSVIEIAKQTSTQLNGFGSRAEFTKWQDGERRSLTQIWGPADGEKFKANAQLVQGFVNAVEARRPGFKQYLEQSGIAHSTMLTETLRQHAERLKGGV